MNFLPAIVLASAMGSVAIGPGGPAPERAATDPPAARILQQAGFDQRLNAQVPLDRPVRDERGRTIPIGALLGHRPAILILGYYGCPMLCSLVLNGAVETLNDLRMSAGEQFDLIDLSIDPTEQPALAAEKKRNYLKRYRRQGADAGWHFLTADGPARRAIADAVGFRYAYDPATKQYAHPSGLVILTAEGKVSQYFFGVTFDARQVQEALVAAGARRIGSPVEQLLMICFHYNPASGPYGALIMRSMRIAGALTLLALGWLIVHLVRRERSAVSRA